MPKLRLASVIVALLGATSVAFSGCAANFGPAPTAVSSPSDSANASATLGPDGYGALKLGMTMAEANATGLVENVTVDANGGCGSDTDGWLKGAPTPSAEEDTARLYFSTNTNKLTAIYAYSSIATPEGITIGSSIDEVLAAYPDWQGEDEGTGIGFAAVPGNDQARYRINIDSESVIALSVESLDQDCY